MWLIDYAEDFSGLSKDQIYRLIKKDVLKPSKQHGAYRFGFADVYVLRVFKILKGLGLSHLDISQAYSYFVELDPRKSLSSYSLFHDTKNVYTIMDTTTFYINATKGGQVILPDTIQPEAIGYALELTRKAMNREEKRLIELKAYSRTDYVREDELEAWLAS